MIDIQMEDMKESETSVIYLYDGHPVLFDRLIYENDDKTPAKFVHKLKVNYEEDVLEEEEDDDDDKMKMVRKGGNDDSSGQKEKEVVEMSQGKKIVLIFMIFIFTIIFPVLLVSVVSIVIIGIIIYGFYYVSKNMKCVKVKKSQKSAKEIEKEEFEYRVNESKKLKLSYLKAVREISNPGSAKNILSSTWFEEEKSRWDGCSDGIEITKNWKTKFIDSFFDVRKFFTKKYTRVITMLITLTIEILVTFIFALVGTIIFWNTPSNSSSEDLSLSFAILGSILLVSNFITMFILALLWSFNHYFFKFSFEAKLKPVEEIRKMFVEKSKTNKNSVYYLTVIPRLFESAVEEKNLGVIRFLAFIGYIPVRKNLLDALEMGNNQTVVDMMIDIARFYKYS